MCMCCKLGYVNRKGSTDHNDWNLMLDGCQMSSLPEQIQRRLQFLRQKCTLLPECGLSFDVSGMRVPSKLHV